MKTPLIVSVGLLMAWLGLAALRPAPQAELVGAWRMVKTTAPTELKTFVAIFTQKHFVFAHYDTTAKRFMGTGGGTYARTGEGYTSTTEFNSWDSTQVGQQVANRVAWNGSQLVVSRTQNGQPIEETWERIDDGGASRAPLAGIWRITGRQNAEGQISTIQRGARKTIKVLSGTRFHWAAINTQTKQFFGCGGGTYTATGGKYTERIEFFSRDNARMGAKLTFDYEVKPDGWHHSGLSSKGDKIYEIWSKDE
jgi:hypothetical protein